MKWKLWLVVFLMIVSGILYYWQTGDTIYLTQKAFVVRVIDGDTIELTNSEKVRLSGIDAPERDECFYLEAKGRLEYLIYGEEKDDSDIIYLERDITNRGKYGRLLRYVYDKNKKLINVLLVKGGYAEAYDKYEYDTKRFDELDAAEQRAKAKGLGMWKCEDYQDILIK